jgi:hypothetical protein
LVFTVLHFTEIVVLAISDYPLSCPYCISLPFIIFTVLLFAKEKYKESTAEFKKP